MVQKLENGVRTVRWQECLRDDDKSEVVFTNKEIKRLRVGNSVERSLDKLFGKSFSGGSFDEGYIGI